MDPKDQHRFLVKNLRLEVEAIIFYVNNLKKLNYAKNKKLLDKLTLDCIKHAELSVKELLELHDGEGGAIRKDILVKAQKEEVGMREIYRYELARTKDATFRKDLQALIRQEEQHLKLVKALR